MTQKFDSLASKFLKLIPMSAAPRNGLFVDANGRLGFALNGVVVWRATGVTGGASVRLSSTGGVVPPTLTSGTDTTPVVTEVYLGELEITIGGSVTGIALLNGSVVAGNVWIGLYDINSALVASCAAAGVAQAGAAAYQQIPFTAPVQLADGTYYLAIAFNNTGARFRSIVAGAFGAGKLTGQVFGTPPVAPALPTTFTTNLGPIASLY